MMTFTFSVWHAQSRFRFKFNIY